MGVASWVYIFPLRLECSRKGLPIATIIEFGGTTVTFLKSRHETQGCFDAFEVTLPTNVHVIAPHLHRNYDETALGVDGITTWIVDGKLTELGPGEQLFVPRGVLHTYGNLHEQSARMVLILTPGLLGPEYFQELAFAMDTGGPPDYAAIGLIMTRYGIIPSTIGAHLPLVAAPLVEQNMPSPRHEIIGTH